jgi:hypothetical protein
MDTRLSSLLTAAAIGLLLVAPAAAQMKKPAAEIVYVPATSNPPVPAGLKVTCLTGPNVLTSSKTCPVVKYQGITTWAYAFIDNRVSMALVSYDAKNTVVRNVTHDGARYVWNAISSLPNQTVMFEGQSNQRISVPWSALGAPKK